MAWSCSWNELEGKSVCTIESLCKIWSARGLKTSTSRHHVTFTKGDIFKGWNYEAEDRSLANSTRTIVAHATTRLASRDVNQREREIIVKISKKFIRLFDITID